MAQEEVKTSAAGDRTTDERSIVVESEALLTAGLANGWALE